MKKQEEAPQKKQKEYVTPNYPKVLAAIGESYMSKLVPAHMTSLLCTKKFAEENQMKITSLDPK